MKRLFTLVVLNALSLLAWRANAASEVRFELTQPIPEVPATAATYEVLPDAAAMSARKWARPAGFAAGLPEADETGEGFLVWKGPDARLQVMLSGAVRLDLAKPEPALGDTREGRADFTTSAREWLARHGVAPDAGEMISGEAPEAGPELRMVVFHRSLGGLPVLGDGAFIAFRFTAEGALLGVDYCWRTLRKEGNVRILNGQAAVERIRRAVATALENSDASDVVVRSVAFGYFDPGPEVAAELYEPHFLVRFDYLWSETRREQVLAVRAVDDGTTEPVAR